MSADLSKLSSDLLAGDNATRLAAAEALCRCGEDALPAVVCLVRAVGDNCEAVREAATSALEELGAPDAQDAQELASLLSDHNPDIGYWAATLLGRLEQEACGCVEQLSAALSEDFAMPVRSRAAWALGRIGPAAASATDQLRLAAESSDARLSRTATRALENI